MSTPQYQKIPGEKLTVDQFIAVQTSLLGKFGCKWSSDFVGHEFYFRQDGTFLEVWA